MTQRRLPGALVSDGGGAADENDFIQKGAEGLWYTRGAAEVVMPNVVITVDAADYVAPARLGAVATIEVDSAGDHEITLCSAPNAGDIIRVVNAGIGSLIVLPGGAATIDGLPRFHVQAPQSMAVFYRRVDGQWAVFSEGANGRSFDLAIGATSLPGGLPEHHTLAVDTTSVIWPATGGIVTLPTTARKGTRVTVCSLGVNSARKEINIDAGSDTINGSTGLLCFNNSYGSVTVIKANVGWAVVGSTAKYYRDVTGAVTLPAAAFWDVAPLCALVQSGFGAAATIGIPTGAPLGTELNIVNVSGGVDSGNIQVAAVGGVIGEFSGPVSITFNHPGGPFAAVTLRKVHGTNNNWVFTAQAASIAV